MVKSKTCIRKADFPENREILVHGFKHTKKDKTGNFILIGCESDKLFENDKLFNFWSIKFMKKR